MTDQITAPVDVPETDEELDRVLARMLAEAPKAPSTPAPAPAPAPSARTGNSQYADEATLDQVAEFMTVLRTAGYTRPELQRYSGFNDSTVWRAQNRKVHATEVEVWLEKVFGPYTRGELPAPAASLRKPKPEALLARIAQLEADAQARVDAVQARIDRAVEVLSSTDAKSVKQLRDVVSAAHAALTELETEVADEPEAPAPEVVDEPAADEPEVTPTA